MPTMGPAMALSVAVAVSLHLRDRLACDLHQSRIRGGRRSGLLGRLANTAQGSVAPRHRPTRTVEKRIRRSARCGGAIQAPCRRPLVQQHTAASIDVDHWDANVDLAVPLQPTWAVTARLASGESCRRYQERSSPRDRDPEKPTGPRPGKDEEPAENLGPCEGRSWIPLTRHELPLGSQDGSANFPSTGKALPGP